MDVLSPLICAFCCSDSSTGTSTRHYFFALSLSPQLPCFLVVTASGKLFTSIVHLFTNTHAHPFNGPFSGTTRVSRYQKGKTNLDFAEARHSELRHMQVCNSLQTDNHVSTPPLSFFTGRMPFLPPNQQRQSTEGTSSPSRRPNKFNQRKSTAKLYYG